MTGIPFLPELPVEQQRVVDGGADELGRRASTMRELKGGTVPDYSEQVDVGFPPHYGYPYSMKTLERENALPVSIDILITSAPASAELNYKLLSLNYEKSKGSQVRRTVLDEDPAEFFVLLFTGHGVNVQVSFKCSSASKSLICGQSTKNAVLSTKGVLKRAVLNAFPQKKIECRGWWYAKLRYLAQHLAFVTFRRTYLHYIQVLNVGDSTLRTAPFVPSLSTPSPPQTNKP